MASMKRNEWKADVEAARIKLDIAKAFVQALNYLNKLM